MKIHYVVPLFISIMLIGCGGPDASLAYPTCSEVDNIIVCGGVEIMPVPEGEQGIAGQDGSNGEDGQDGRDGESGTDGLSGSDGRDGIDGSNGNNGLDGNDGLSALVKVIDPCGPQTNWDEVLFQMNGKACNEEGVCTDIFAVFYQGNKIFLTGLYPGAYQTTDGTKCNFKVTDDLEVVW